MNEPSALLNDLSEDAVWRLEEVCCRFEQSWQAGRRPRLEDFLADAKGAERRALLRELLRLDVHYRRQAGERPTAEDYVAHSPDAADLWRGMFPGGDASAAPAAERTTDAEGTLRPLVGGAQSTVGVVGTPAFMSPEQAAGKVHELGPAT